MFEKNTLSQVYLDIFIGYDWLYFFSQGILLEHREKEFGDKVNMLAVLRAACKMREDMKG